MISVLFLLFLFNVDCVQPKGVLVKPFYNVTVNLRGQDVVFRVVNGNRAKLGDVPYQVGFMMRKDAVYETFCGGSIISPSRVLSAAHCFVEDKVCCRGKLLSSEVNHIHAVAGNLNTKAYNKGSGQWRVLSGGIYPTTYNFPKDDVALLHTKKPFVFNSYVKPMPLAKKDIDYSGITCTVSGFGYIGMEVQSQVLLFAKVKTLSKDLCNRVHSDNMSSFVCTSDFVSDVHKGDSGGPLVCKDTGDPAENDNGLVVGVVSGKIFDYPSSSFFTRVSSFHQFIENKSSDMRFLYTTHFSLAVILIKFVLIFNVLLIFI